MPAYAVVSMTKKPVDILVWLSYYLERQGAARMYLRIEDTPGLVADIRAWAEARSLIGKIEIEEAVGVDTRDSYDRQQHRQHDFLTDVIRAARQDGCDYLLHVDDDEIVVASQLHGCRIDRLLAHRSQEWDDYHNLHLDNYEAAAAVSPEDVDCYVDRAYRYIACREGGCRSYANGKSLGNLHHRDLRPHGPHAFAGRSLSVPPTDAIVLHFDSCTFSRWHRKFQNLSNVSNDVFDRIPFSFYKESIRILDECATACAVGIEDCRRCDARAGRYWSERMRAGRETGQSIEDLGMCNPFRTTASTASPVKKST